MRKTPNAKKETLLITEEMIETGYNLGIVRLVECSDINGVACQIGDYWFYFDDNTADDITVAKYIEKISKTDIINMIFELLEDFRKQEHTIDEYNYYAAILTEQLTPSTIDGIYEARATNTNKIVHGNLIRQPSSKFAYIVTPNEEKILGLYITQVIPETIRRIKKSETDNDPTQQK